MLPINPPLIILEGADGVGKSTLGRSLARQFDGFYFHATATKTLIPAMADYQKNLMENILENVFMGKTVVMDRFWPSELIYGSVFRPDNPYGFTHHLIKQQCDQIDAIYVCCFSSTAIERHKIKKDPAHPYDDTSFEKIYKHYENFYELHGDDQHFIPYILERWGSNMIDFGKFIHSRYNGIRNSKLSLAEEHSKGT